MAWYISLIIPNIHNQIASWKDSTRQFREQFVAWHIDELEQLEIFNANLMEYLIWYNTEKPHRGIGKLPPLRYYLDNFYIIMIVNN